MISGIYDNLRILNFVHKPSTKYIIMKIIFTLFTIFSVLSATAQQTISVRGVVRTEDGKNLGKASVSLYYTGSKDTLKTVTNEKGTYVFGKVFAKEARITISYIGYKKLAESYDFSSLTGEVVNNEVIMTPGDNTLETVTIETSKIQIKEDTVSYKIDSTMFRKNDNVEEVLKKRICK